MVQSALNDQSSGLTPLDDAKRAFERDYLVRILKITQGNVAQAAKLAQRNRTEFYKLLERHRLEPKMFKSEDVKETNVTIGELLPAGSKK